MTNKLFVIICVIGFFLTFILLYTVTSLARNLLYQDAKILLDNQARQTVNAFDQYMDIIENTVMTASRQKSIQSLINGNYTEYGSYLVYRDAYAYMKNVHEFYDWINIYVVVKDTNYIMSSNPEDVTGDYRKKGIAKTEWYKQLESSTRETLIMSNFVPPVSRDKEQFAYALKVRNIYNWDVKGYIIATIDKNVLDELIRGTSFEVDGFMLVLTPEGEIAYNSDLSLTGVDISVKQLASKLGEGGSYSLDREREFYYSSWESKTSGWYFITFVSANHAKAQIFKFQLMVTMIGLLTVLFLVAVARLSAKAYIKPVNRLIDFIHDIEKKEFSGQIDLKQKDEMGDLIRSFNLMIASVRQNQVLRKKAEIDALQKQINPHFLFNTFQSIKSLAQQNDVRGTILMIERLSDIFHYNTNRSNTPMTEIRNEVNHIRNYLDIQRIRFGSRMEVFYDIDDGILGYWTPRFILQPIVENSISHSMENMKSGYSLNIRGGFSGDDIIFVIRDNGIGIPKEKLCQLREYVYDKENKVQSDDSGIGLKNIQERLSLFFGDDYGLTIESVMDDYTQIQVKIPKCEKAR